MLVFDIETEGLPDEELSRMVKPFDESSMPHPGKFDPASVKLGNLKDAAKIEEKVEAARMAHEKAVEDFAATLESAKQSHYAAAKDRAALDATTGRICAIGYMNDAGNSVLHTILHADEERILREFWNQFAKMRDSRRNMIGFYSNRFDVPFVCRRSWMLGVKVPTAAFTPTGYVSPTFIDLADKWKCGDRMHSINLDTLAKALGVGGKPDDCTGADFARLLRSNDPAEQQAAINYLTNDLKMTLGCAVKLCA